MTTTIGPKAKVITPSKAACDVALACRILARAEGVSPHTKRALLDIAARIMSGVVGAVTWSELQDAVYSYFATRD